MSQLGSFATLIKSKNINLNCKQSNIQMHCFLQKFFMKSFYSYTHFESGANLLEKIIDSLKHCFKNAEHKKTAHL